VYTTLKNTKKWRVNTCLLGMSLERVFIYPQILMGIGTVTNTIVPLHPKLVNISKIKVSKNLCSNWCLNPEMILKSNKPLFQLAS